MSEQNFKNHTRLVGPFHFFTLPLLLLTLIGAGINLWKSIGDHQRLYSASLIFTLTLCTILASLFARLFALKAQDRAIRAEENFRHYLLTGKTLDARLTVPQIVALRFASDAEFVDLASKAAESGMEQKQIKMAIQNWRGDYYRV